MQVSSTFSDFCNLSVLTLKPLPNGKILDKSKSKAFADDNLKVIQMVNLFWIRQKTLLEKNNMLVSSIFFFSHNVF